MISVRARPIPRTMQPKDTKPVVEEQSAISVFELTTHPAFRERAFAKRRFVLGNTEVRLLKDPRAHDWYLELTKPWTGCANSTISLIHTPYGLIRRWPWANKEGLLAMVDSYQRNLIPLFDRVDEVVNGPREELDEGDDTKIETPKP